MQFQKRKRFSCTGDPEIEEVFVCVCVCVGGGGGGGGGAYIQGEGWCSERAVAYR